MGDEYPARLRVTLRGDGVEVRGYATWEAVKALSEAGHALFVVIASPALDGYDPWADPNSRHSDGGR